MQSYNKIRLIHDTVGGTLTVWLGDSAAEYVCEETTDEVVLMKNSAGQVIGFELLHYQPASTIPGVVEAVVW